METEKNQLIIKGPIARPAADILKPSEFAVAKYSGPGIASNVIVSSCIEAKSPALLSIICNDITIHTETGVPFPS